MWFIPFVDKRVDVQVKTWNATSQRSSSTVPSLNGAMSSVYLLHFLPFAKKRSTESVVFYLVIFSYLATQLQVWQYLIQAVGKPGRISPWTDCSCFYRHVDWDSSVYGMSWRGGPSRRSCSAVVINNAWCSTHSLTCRPIIIDHIRHTHALSAIL